MWNAILGALVLFGMAVVLPSAPKLVDAWCDRIRYGVQTSAELTEDVDDEPEPEPARAAVATPKAATKPAATTTSSSPAAA